jgi:hypothetical protein
MTYRVYFNRKSEYPQVWAVDEGSQESEINVSSVEIYVPVISRCLSQEEMNSVDHNRAPVAWFECRGALSVVNGIAYIR